MALPRLAAGSVGRGETAYCALPAPVPLDCCRELHPVRVAYETYGELAPARDNVVLVCHALSGDAHAAGWAADGGPTALDGIGADERGGGAAGGGGGPRRGAGGARGDRRRRARRPAEGRPRLVGRDDRPRQAVR